MDEGLTLKVHRGAASDNQPSTHLQSLPTRPILRATPFQDGAWTPSASVFQERVNRRTSISRSDHGDMPAPNSSTIIRQFQQYNLVVHSDGPTLTTEYAAEFEPEFRIKRS
jgi:hypothetical protein